MVEKEKSKQDLHGVSKFIAYLKADPEVIKQIVREQNEAVNREKERAAKR